MPGAKFRVLLLVWLVACTFPCPGLAAAIAYRVELPGLSADLTHALSSVSDCVNLLESPPETPGLLSTRMHNDLKSFTDALNSLGYFKAALDAKLDTSTSPATVRFQITPGPRFVFSQPELALSPANPEALDLLRGVLARLEPKSEYASSLILNVENALLEELKQNGYPAPFLEPRSVVADHAANTADVHLALNTGPKATFGNTIIDGLNQVRPEYIRERLAWKTGTPFDTRAVDLTREQIVRTGLFRSVNIATGSVTNGQVEMRVQVLEAPHRTVRSGLWYYSDQGLGGGTGWTHRNLFGGGQELNLDAQLSEKFQSASATLAMPNTWRPAQTLGLSAAWVHELTDVYESNSLATSAVLTRTISEIRLGYGLAYRLAEIEEDGDIRRFNLISFPLSADLDRTDAALDPTSGLALSTRVEPFTALEDSSSSFVRWSVNGRHYLPLAPAGRLILATRAHYGVLAGTGRESVPEDLLLYAGGGGSVRGYAYQYAGALDEDDEPLGGMSVVDFTAELRWRINQEFGAVVFGDGGRAFEGREPSEVENYFWAVGGGIRYYTPIGPIRMDLAVPMERRDGIDDPFQIYVSLGQAF